MRDDDDSDRPLSQDSGESHGSGDSPLSDLSDGSVGEKKHQEMKTSDPISPVALMGHVVDVGEEVADLSLSRMNVNDHVAPHFECSDAAFNYDSIVDLIRDTDIREQCIRERCPNRRAFPVRPVDVLMKMIIDKMGDVDDRDRNEFVIDWTTFNADVIKRFYKLVLILHDEKFYGKSKYIKAGDTIFVFDGLTFHECSETTYDLQTCYDAVMTVMVKLADNLLDQTQLTTKERERIRDVIVHFKPKQLAFKQATEHFESRGHQWNLNAKTLVFDDCIFDLNTATLVPPGPRHIVDHNKGSIGYDLVSHSDEKLQSLREKMIELEDIFREMMLDNYDSLMHALALALFKTNIHQVFIFLVGKGANGISFLVDLTERTFKNFSKKCAPSVLGSPSSHDKPNAALVDCAEKSILFFSELGSAGATISNDSFKMLTDGDTIRARRHYQKNLTEFTCGRFFAATNSAPIFRSIVDEAELRRLCIIDFPCKYLTEAELEAVREKDKALYDSGRVQLRKSEDWKRNIINNPDYAIAFMYLILNYYRDHQADILKRPPRTPDPIAFIHPANLSDGPTIAVKRTLAKLYQPASPEEMSVFNHKCHHIQHPLTIAEECSTMFHVRGKLKISKDTVSNVISTTIEMRYDRDRRAPGSVYLKTGNLWGLQGFNKGPHVDTNRQDQ